MSESLSNPEQLTPEVLDMLRQCVERDLHSTQIVERKHLMALIAAAKRDIEQQKRIAELEGQIAGDRRYYELSKLSWASIHEHQQGQIDKLSIAKSHMDYCRTLVALEDGDVLADGIDRLNQRIAALEALLDRVPHLMVFAVCNALNCPRCAWEKMKGGAK